MNRDQNSYLTVIGVHSIMHLMHTNYCKITSINTVGLGVSALYTVGVYNMVIQDTTSGAHEEKERINHIQTVVISKKK